MPDGDGVKRYEEEGNFFPKEDATISLREGRGSGRKGVEAGVELLLGLAAFWESNTKLFTTFDRLSTDEVTESLKSSVNMKEDFSKPDEALMAQTFWISGGRGKRLIPNKRRSNYFHKATGNQTFFSVPQCQINKIYTNDVLCDRNFEFP